jgi:tetratricopeptide (TPR) repeat protein
MLYAGPLVVGPQGGMDIKPLLRRYVAAYEDFGLHLVSPESIPDNPAVLAGLRLREPSLWGAVVHSLADLVYVMRSEKVAAADAELAGAERKLDAILRVIEPDPFDRDLRIAEAAWEKEERDDFSQFLTEEALSKRSGTELGRLAGALIGVPDRQDQAYAVLDRAIETQPDNYGLHTMRGGLAMMRGAPNQDAKELATAATHYEIARALRPRSGLAHVMLGVATVFSGDYSRAAQLVEKGTRLEPDNSLIWLLAADFYKRSPLKEKALEAARKALALDPTLVKAKQIIQELEAATTRKGG